MNNQFTETTTNSFGSRITGSIKGVLIGLLLFVVSFGILYWNEGRVDVSKIAQTAVEIESNSQASPEMNNQFISTTGVLKSDEKIGDTFLKKGNYIFLRRNVEMYSWVEQEDSESESNVGGSETVTNTYTYKKEWTSMWFNSDNFKEPKGHENPRMPLEENYVKVKHAKIGIYNVDMSKIVLPQERSIKLNNNNVILNNNFKLANDKYLFKGKGTINNPEIGDIRINYMGLLNPIETATIFGKLDITNKKISPYYGPKNKKIYRIFRGTRDDAIATMKTEHKVITWILRALGFALMWFGLMSLFGPISIFLDVLPIFGSISRIGIAIITFIVSLILSIVTILVSMIAHNLITLVIVVLVFIIGIVWYLKKKRKKYSTTSAPRK